MKYLLILALLCSPVYAHDRDPKPVPVIPSGNDNHNNDSDNLKHVAEAVIITGAVVWLYNHYTGNKDEKTVIHFSNTQRKPLE